MSVIAPTSMVRVAEPEARSFWIGAGGALVAGGVEAGASVGFSQGGAWQPAVARAAAEIATTAAVRRARPSSRALDRIRPPESRILSRS
ncbi:hypothetical protein Agsp01_16080 [Agromyces sp. NBRC 114283]|nr:hypothetical protein Agsp01_16080 [Agromyces sp. NBRC 114283]